MFFYFSIDLEVLLYNKLSCTCFYISDQTVAASSYQILPSGYWWSLLYATGVALLCLVVCLIGAHIYAKATFVIFLVVMIVLATIFISFFAEKPRVITLPSSAVNGTGIPTTANFTGFKLETLKGNLEGKEKFLATNLKRSLSAYLILQCLDLYRLSFVHLES